MSDPPKRPKPSEWISAYADRLFANWGGNGVANDLQRLRLALRSRQSAAEAYQDEEQARREALERDLLERIRLLEKHAHTHPTKAAK